MRRYRGKKGKGHQETCIKDPWTKPKGGRIEGGRWGWLGWRGVVWGKWRQLYLNINKKKIWDIFFLYHHYPIPTTTILSRQPPIVWVTAALLEKAKP